jgi:hypothetical protein
MKIYSIFVSLMVLSVSGPVLADTMFKFELPGGVQHAIAANESKMTEMSSRIVRLALEYTKSANIGSHVDLLKLVAPAEEIAEAFKGNGKTVFWHRPGKFEKYGMDGYMTFQQYLASKNVHFTELVAKSSLGARMKGIDSLQEASDSFRLAATHEKFFADSKAIFDFGRGVSTAPAVVAKTAVQGDRHISWLARAGGAAAKTLAVVGPFLKGATVGLAGYESWSKGDSKSDAAVEVLKEFDTGIEGPPPWQLLDEYRKAKEKGSK